MPTKQGVLKLIGRLFLYIFLVAGIIAGSVLMNIFGPSRHSYMDDDWKNITPIDVSTLTSITFNVTLDQHSHTTYSDGVLSVKQNVEWHIAMGYNAIVITDHNNIANKADIDSLKAEYAAKNVTIIQGMEWTTGRLHANLIGISEWTLPIPGSPTDDDIKAMIAETHRQGGVVTINHFPWSINQTNMQNHPTRQQASNWGANFIEIVNDDSQPIYVFDVESDTFCDSSQIGKITGTDMHEPDYLEGGGVSGWTLLNVTAYTEEAIMTQLRNNNTLIYSVNNTKYDDPVQHPDNPAHLFVKPISELGAIFVALYDNGLDLMNISIYLVYIFGIFGLLEIFRYVKPKFKDRFGKSNKKRES